MAQQVGDFVGAHLGISQVVLCEQLADYAISCEEEYKAYLQYIPQYVGDGMPVPVLTLSGLFSSRHGKFRGGPQR